MSTKNLSRIETNYLSNGGVNDLISNLYQLVRQNNGIPEELKPHWDLLKSLLINSKTVTSESTEELVTYILAIGDLSNNYKFDGGIAA